MATYRVVPYTPPYNSAFLHHANLIDEHGAKIAYIVSDTKWGQRRKARREIRKHERALRNAETYEITSEDVL